MKRKMKNTMLSAAAGMMALLLAACSTNDVTLDPTALADTVLEQVDFDAELEQASAITAQLMYVLPENAQIALYMGNGSYADEFAVITCAAKEDVAAAEQAAKQHLDEVKTSFEAYIPEEAAKIEDAVVKTVGNYVIVCVSDDDNAASVIDAAVK